MNVHAEPKLHFGRKSLFGFFIYWWKLGDKFSREFGIRIHQTRLVALASVQSRTENWQKCSSFLPENWSQERRSGKLPNLAHLFINTLFPKRDCARDFWNSVYFRFFFAASSPKTLKFANMECIEPCLENETKFQKPLAPFCRSRFLLHVSKNKNLSMMFSRSIPLRTCTPSFERFSRFFLNFSQLHFIFSYLMRFTMIQCGTLCTQRKVTKFPCFWCLVFGAQFQDFLEFFLPIFFLLCS